MQNRTIEYRNLEYRSYLGPKYWSMWCALGLAWLIAYLPLRVQQWLGRMVGQIAYRILKSRRRICEANIGLCFPELDSASQKQLVIDCFESNGMGIFEAFRSWFRSPRTLIDKVDYHGGEHLQAALEKGKGVILVGAHYSTLDLAGKLTTLFFKADVMQRDHSNGLFNAVMSRSRGELYGEVLGKHDLRGLIRCLKKNHVVWYATDQDYGRKGCVFAPFFNIPCSTLTTTMRIAKKTGAQVVPFSHFRKPGAKGYSLYIHKALENFPSEDMELDAARLNAIIEAEIRKHPEQYLWMHRRFKTPPQPGTKNVYGQIRN